MQSNYPRDLFIFEMYSPINKEIKISNDLEGRLLANDTEICLYNIFFFWPNNLMN